MNIKLHNYYEVIIGDKKYTAENTLTQNAIHTISNLGQFATYFAFGTGTTPVSYSDNKMSNYTCSFATTLEDIQDDLSKGSLYVKRVLVLGENDSTGLRFCEIGMTNTNSYDPNICNHVLLKDENDNVVTALKRAGQQMIVRVTVYLVINQNSQNMFCLGSNRLIKALLGEYFGNKQFTAVRGNVLADNTSIYRNVPRSGTPVTCAVSNAQTQTGYNLTIDFDLVSGKTAEVVIMLDGEPVIRYNTTSFATEEVITESKVSQTNNTIALGEYIKSVDSIVDSDNGEVGGVVVKKFATDFSDYLANPFDATFTSSMPRWVSNDGNKLAFVSANTLYLYINLNYQLVKIANNINVNNLQKIIMFEDNVFAIYNGEPHLAMYKIVDSSLVRKEVDFTNYLTFDSTFDWQDVEIISNGSNTFMMGAIFGAISRRPIIINASYENNIFTINSVNYGICDYICHIFAIYRSSFCDSLLGFITNNYEGEANNCRIEEHYLDGTTSVSNQITAYYMCNGAVSVKGKSRALVATRSSSPYIWLFYYPQKYRYSISLTDGVENYISTNLKYLIQHYSSGDVPYKIYSLDNYNNPVEFENGFPSEIDLSTVTDFEFLNDSLIVFTTTNTYVINLKETKTLIENLPASEQTYTITYTKYHLMGESEDEGVTGTLTLGVSA